jgi:hypothetical protein
MEVGETAVRYRYLCRLQVYVSAPLALQAGPGHLCNGLGHLWPAELGGDEAAGRAHSRVVYRVQRLKNRLPVLDRYQRAIAIAEKSTGCASAMAARMGESGAASPSSGQSSAVRAGEGHWVGGGGCAAAEGGRLKASATMSPGPVCVECLK